MEGRALKRNPIKEQILFSHTMSEQMKKIDGSKMEKQMIIKDADA